MRRCLPRVGGQTCCDSQLPWGGRSRPVLQAAQEQGSPPALGNSVFPLSFENGGKMQLDVLGRKDCPLVASTCSAIRASFWLAGCARGRIQLLSAAERQHPAHRCISWVCFSQFCLAISFFFEWGKSLFWYGNFSSSPLLLGLSSEGQLTTSVLIFGKEV